MSLGDEHTGVVDRLGQTKLEDLGLESSLQEILDTEGKDVIELHSVLVQNTDSHKSSDKGIALEKSLRVLLITGQKITSSTTDLGKLEGNSVDLSLVLQTVFAGELELSIQTRRVVLTCWDGVSLGIFSRSG